MDVQKSEKYHRSVQQREGDYFYNYLYDETDRLKKVRVLKKQKIFKKLYGEYTFNYNGKRLLKQISQVEGQGITEWISYLYDEEKRISSQEYYNERNQLRYRVSFFYDDKKETPSKMSVIRMEKFPYFESDDPKVIEKLTSIRGKDFEGAFYLLDIIDEVKYGS